MRLLSLHPSTTELLFALGAGGFLVGRTDACLYPEAAQKVPSIGSGAEIDLAQVEIFEPTLVLLGPRQQELATQVDKKYTTFVLDPETLDDVYEDIAKLGTILGKEIEAEVVLHELRSAIERVSARASTYRSLRAYVEVEHQPPRSATGYIGELIIIAGGEPFSGTPTVEALSAFDPNMIISAAPNDEESVLELLAARDGWNALQAVRHERLFVIDSELLLHPGPRLVQGLKRLAKILHGIDVNGA